MLDAAFSEVVARRRSVRAFQPEPLPPEMLRWVFDTARMAPSNCNIQPWIVHVASGEILERLRSALRAEAEANRFRPDVASSGELQGVYRKRRNASAKALFDATGVARHDMDARRHSFLRNFSMFEAPHVAFVFMPRGFGVREACDVGMFAQTLMLALTAQGLASCAQGALSQHPDLVRQILGLDQDLVCLFGISFGRADEDHASTLVRTERAELEDTVFFHD